MKNALFALPLILAIGCSQAQIHTDAKENGLKGNIKSLTQYQYTGDKVIRQDTALRVADKDEFEAKRIFFYNSNGNIDSIISTFRGPTHYDNKIQTWQSYQVNSFDKNGKKTGYRLYGNNRELFNEVEIKWLDGTHYTLTTYQVSDGKRGSKTAETEITLTDGQRELSYEVKEYGGWSGEKLQRHFTTTNTIDKNDHLTAIDINFKTKTEGPSHFNYIYQKFDSHQNPLTTYQTAGKSQEITRLFISEYTYY